MTNEIHQLEAGQRVHLEIFGVIGLWEKMSDGGNNLTNGIKPVGVTTQEFWQSLYEDRKEGTVSICKSA